MPKYAMLMKLTEQGRRRLDDTAGLMADIQGAWASIDGEADVYLMMGEYDFLVVGTAPRPDDVVVLSLAIAKAGDVTTTTTCIHAPAVVGEKQFFVPAGGAYRSPEVPDVPGQ
jgi:uncharacterized protein with GYD domain